MNPEELKRFSELDISIGENIGKHVSVICDFGWVSGNLSFKHGWIVKSPNCSFEFDTDDVNYISVNTIFLKPKLK